MSLLRDTARAIRHNPLLMLACMPPWFFIPEVRVWVHHKMEEEDLEVHLRAVIPPDEIEAALEWIDDATERFREMYTEHPEPAPTRARVMRRYLETYMLTGDHPRP